MPVYEYRCDNGHVFDVMQRMSDDPVTSCSVCSASVQRIFNPVAVHFKGSGFYNTDYGKQKRGKAASSSDDSGGSSSEKAGGDSSSSSGSGDSSSSGSSDKSAGSSSKTDSKPASAA